MSKKNKFIESGYNILKEKNELDYLYKLAKKLVKKKKKIRKPIFGLPANIVNSYIIQFYLQRILHLNFNKSVLIALGNEKKLNFGLPTDLLKWLEAKEGFKSVNFSNKIKWQATVFYWYFVGLFFSIKYLILSFNHLNSTINNNVDFSYFDGLSELNFPNNFANSKTIINWYITNKKKTNIKEIVHNVKTINNFNEKDVLIRYSDLPFKLEINLRFFLKFFLSMTIASTEALFDIFRGKTEKAFLLKEFPLLYLSTKATKVDFACNYYFHNSTAIYKPLWTYIAEKNSSKVILYFYSANNRIVKIDEKDHLLYGHREFMSWKIFYVWDLEQANYLKSILPNSKIEVVGPIWFQSNNTFPYSIRNLEKKIISIFDVQPYKMDRYRVLGLPNEYYISTNLISFHNDIFELFNSSKEYLIVLKRKRNTQLLDNAYLKRIDDIYSNLPFIQINPEVDAASLIEISHATIHYPTTSTAIIAKNIGVKSIYYDSTCKINSDENNLSGVKLIQGRSRLSEWIKVI